MMHSSYLAFHQKTVGNLAEEEPNLIEPIGVDSEQVALDQEISEFLADACLGIGVTDVLSNDFTAIFGVHNDRPVDKASLARLLTSFKDDGIYRTENPMPVVMKRNLVDLSSLDQRGDSEDRLLKWNWSDSEIQHRTVKFAGGQHRQAALRELQLAERTELEKLNKKLQTKKRGNASEKTTQEIMDLMQRIKDKEKVIQTMGYWAVAIYDEGMSS